MELIYIASAIVSLITLICFWVLCFNISVIKKEISKDDSQILLSNFNKARAFGDMDKARDILKQIIWNDILRINGNTLDKATRISKYEKTEKEYAKLLEQMDMKFPDLSVFKD